MAARILLVLGIGLLSLYARADDDNPYKGAKVGDFAKYKAVMKLGDNKLEGTMTETVTARTDKEVTLKMSGKIGGLDLPPSQEKIDYTKPFDPARVAGVSGTNVKAERGKEGKEKIKVAGKEYESTWTNYKLRGKANGAEVDSEIKVWMSKEAPTPILRLEMTANVGGSKTELFMELLETGSMK